MYNKVIVIHIPKTAGSSLQANLSWARGAIHGNDKGTISIDFPIANLPYFEGLARHAEQRLPELLSPGFQVMNGHFRYRDIAPVLGALRPQVSLVTFLRDPIKRTISDYLYSSSPRHKGRDAFVASYPSFESYCKNTGEMNKQFDYMRPFTNAPLDVTIESARRNIDFIGRTEQFDQDYTVLVDALGVPDLRTESQNVSPRQDAARDTFEKYSDMLHDILSDDIALCDALSEDARDRAGSTSIRA
ncbi:MAG: sulfotransferase family 2 domain-containing protein [Litoreibacter sp.]|uniref:sulfotransferase family 2 domain-containing protein n=1 Tax=Litoreibacter sp. TaxID=1969459 RepID=UPI00329712DA